MLWMTFIILHLCVCICVLDATLWKLMVLSEHEPWVIHVNFPNFSKINSRILQCYIEKYILNAYHGAWYTCMIEGEAEGWGLIR